MSKRTPRPLTNTWSLVLSSRSETESFGRRIGRSLEGGTVLALRGELGSGKTTLVRGIAAGLGTPASEVSSPTFVLIHEYRGRLPLVHVDLYRLRHEGEAWAIGLIEHFNDTAVTAIEWADRFPSLLPEDRLEIELAHRTPATRAAQLSARGPQSRRLLSRLKESRPTAASVTSSRAGTGRRTTRSRRP